MSVRNTKYIMWGVEVQYPHYQSIVGDDDEKYDELDIQYRNKDGVGFISDGMNGNYAVAGKVLATFEEGGRDIMPDGVSKLSDIFSVTISEDAKKDILDKLDGIFGYRPVCDYIFINHYH